MWQEKRVLSLKTYVQLW